MNISRIQTTQGVVISFGCSNIDVVGKKIPLKSSRAFLRVMSNAPLKELAEDPIDRGIGRMWVVKGEKLYDKPSRSLIISDDGNPDEDVCNF